MRTTEEAASDMEALLEVWRDKLLQLDSQRVHNKPAPDRWSLSEVVGHLIDSACNNHQRFVRAQHCDELEFPKYDQNTWAAAANYRGAEWQSLVQLWYHYNRQLAVLIRHIPASELATVCKITQYEPCTLAYLVHDYVDHLQHHLQKMEERIVVEF